MVDADTPMLAVADAVRAFKPDHILLALRGTDHNSWQEHHLVDRARQRFHIPMTVFEIDRSGHAPAQDRAEQSNHLPASEPVAPDIGIAANE
jgi:hypothetical protein